MKYAKDVLFVVWLCSFPWGLFHWHQGRFNWNAFEVKAWVSNYIGGKHCHWVVARLLLCNWRREPYSDVAMSTMASQITAVSTVYLTMCSGADQRKHQSFAPLSFVRGIYRWPVDSHHHRPVTRKMFPFDYIIIATGMWVKSFVPSRNKGQLRENRVHISWDVLY